MVEAVSAWIDPGNDQYNTNLSGRANLCSVMRGAAVSIVT